MQEKAPIFTVHYVILLLTVCPLLSHGTKLYYYYNHNQPQQESAPQEWYPHRNTLFDYYQQQQENVDNPGFYDDDYYQEDNEDLYRNTNDDDDDDDDENPYYYDEQSPGYGRVQLEPPTSVQDSSHVQREDKDVRDLKKLIRTDDVKNGAGLERLFQKRRHHQDEIINIPVEATTSMSSPLSTGSALGSVVGQKEAVLARPANPVRRFFSPPLMHLLRQKRAIFKTPNRNIHENHRSSAVPNKDRHVN